jgi:hypothetical protein
VRPRPPIISRARFCANQSVRSAARKAENASLWQYSHKAAQVTAIQGLDVTGDVNQRNYSTMRDSIHRPYRTRTLIRLDPTISAKPTRRSRRHNRFSSALGRSALFCNARVTCAPLLSATIKLTGDSATNPAQDDGLWPKVIRNVPLYRMSQQRTDSMEMPCLRHSFIPLAQNRDRG